MKAIRVHTPGGIEALSYEDIPDPSPAANEVLVRTEAAGVNYIDTYQRTGRYPVEPPFTLGMEGAGVVVEVGSDVTTLETLAIAWRMAPRSVHTPSCRPSQPTGWCAFRNRWTPAPPPPSCSRDARRTT